MSAAASITGPLASALSHTTAPYERGAFTQDLELGPAAVGLSHFTGYTFSVFQLRFGVQSAEIAVSYKVMLTGPPVDAPLTLELAYINDNGPGTANVLVPSGTLPGESFVIPTPADGGPVFLRALRERPAPASGAPSGPDKWKVTALLGNTARLLALLLGERQAIAATGTDVLEQRHLATARAGSLDRIGEALGVPRLLPSPYRLDLDTDVMALYHLDDAIATVIDATGEHTGVSHGAQRGVPGKIARAVQISADGGVTIPDDTAFAIPGGASFTVEMFAQLPPMKAGTRYVLAVKRSHGNDASGSGWALTAQALDAETGTLTLSVTDHDGNQVQAVTGKLALTVLFHVAGVLDGAGRTVIVFVNGQPAAKTPTPALAAIQNCADVGLGADRTGASLMTGGLLDEVRFSRAARTDFSSVLGGTPYKPDPDTIALYHLDETADLIDDTSAQHFALNRGATRGIPARFGNGVRFTGDPLPESHCAAEAEFQRRLRTNTWDRSLGGAKVAAGPYARFGYRQGAISLPGLTSDPQPVLVNDSPALDARSRGVVATACFGFAPTDLNQTIAALQAAGRSAQEAIDYFGDWNGEPESFYTAQYASHGVTAAHETCLPAPGAPTSILITGDAGLVIDANTNLTVEAIVLPDDIADDHPRAIAASRSTGLREGETNPGEAGWALSICGCACIPNNVEWVLGDAAGNLVTVVAGVDVADGAFHHVAGVLDRDTGTALLFLDGVEVAKQPIGPLGAVGTAGDATIGNDPALDAPYAGLIDEVRFSRAARRGFHPVLGESDNRYRQRLAIYAPYRLPNFITLQRAVRALSLPTSSTADEVAARAVGLLLSYDDPVEDGQLDVLETDSTRFCAGRQFRILPAKLAPGQSIAANGTSPADEIVVTGTYTFHQEALTRHFDAPGLSFASEQARWMIVRAAQGLDALVARVQSILAATQIVVQTGWDPVTALHSQGRSLDIAVASAGPGLDLGLIAALAHQVGVDYVAFDAGGAFVRLSFAPGSDLEVKALTPVLAPGASTPVVVTRPSLAHPDLLTCRMVRCGTGDGSLSRDVKSFVFHAAALGQVTLVVEYPLPGGGSLTGSCEVTIAPGTLDGCTTIDASGKTGVTEAEASGPPDADFDPAYLISSHVAGLTYASADARRMQLPLDGALQSLATLLAAEPGTPHVTVLAAFAAGAATLQSVGRGLILAPSDASITAARLGALAYRAGFSYIERRRYPASVYASVRPGPRFRIVRSPIQRLWLNARISGLGQFMAREFAAAGPPDAGFTVTQLQTYAHAGVTFAAGVSNQVQATLAAALDRLVAALAADAIAGNVQVIGAFDPAATDLSSVGRAVLMRHAGVAADRLSGYALAAGFGFVQHRANATGGAAVYAAAYAANSTPPDVFTGDDLILDVMAELSIEPQLPISGAFDWCLTPCCGAAASLRTALTPPGAAGLFIHKVLIGAGFGAVTVDASFSLDDAAEPYQFLLQPRFRDGVPPRLTKDQYDDLLNFADAYCPVGVEAITRGIRGFVHGFARPPGWSQLPTRATFPRYRLNR